jgi:hypothetical protein
MNRLLQTKALLCGIFLTLFFSSFTHAADGTPVWTNFLSGAGSPNAIAVDSNSNAVVVGSGPVVKYSSVGMPIWTNSYGNSSQGTTLTIDSSNNVYVTGSWLGLNWDFMTIKYSGAGIPLWTNSFNGAGNNNDFAAALVLDGNGNVFVTGQSTGSGGNYDYATIKYSNAGVPLWTNIFNGTGNGNDHPYSLAADGNGNVIVTGYSNGSGSGNDWATIKYSSVGLPLWTNLFNGVGNGDDAAIQLAVDSTGNVYVTGFTTGTGSGFDAATIKYSSAGIPLWTNIFNGVGNGTDEGRSIALDKNNNVIMSGYTTDSRGVADCLTIKYSSAGMPLWTNICVLAGNTNIYPSSLAVDANGNVYITGYSASGNYYSFVTLKYSSAGMSLWTNFFSRSTGLNHSAYSVAVDGSSNVYVTGKSANGSATDYATIKYSGPPPNVFSFITTNGSFGFTSNQFLLLLTGPAGSNAVISVSTNLQTWVPLMTNPLTGGTLTFTDTLATNYIYRFYRATLQ